MLNNLKKFNESEDEVAYIVKPDKLYIFYIIYYYKIWREGLNLSRVSLKNINFLGNYKHLIFEKSIEACIIRRIRYNYSGIHIRIIKYKEM